jgi:hypothetical protein
MPWTERVDYWYLRPRGASTWTEVDRETWLAAERRAGFIAQHRGEPATASWSGMEQEGCHTVHARGCLQPIDMGHATCPVGSSEGGDGDG